MRKRFLRSNGQSLVEFAIILPFSVVLVLGVIEWDTPCSISTSSPSCRAKGRT